jgi:hypothetical protein
MNKSYFTVVLTLACLLGLGISARAQDARTVVTKVPFEFVAGGQALPAGTYSVSRLSDSPSVLVIRSYNNSTRLLPVVFDGVPADHAELTFERVGDKYLLSKVGTPVGAYTIATPRAMTRVAQMKDHDTVSSSGGD